MNKPLTLAELRALSERLRAKYRDKDLDNLPEDELMAAVYDSQHLAEKACAALPALLDAAERAQRLEAAIREHHEQKADDRCWLDDHKLYAAAGLPPADYSIESPSAMLKNCERFVELRMCGREGAWKSYAELEAENTRLRADLAACQCVCKSLAERCHGQSESLSRRAEKPD